MNDRNFLIGAVAIGALGWSAIGYGVYTNGAAILDQVATASDFEEGYYDDEFETGDEDYEPDPETEEEYRALLHSPSLVTRAEAIEAIPFTQISTENIGTEIANHNEAGEFLIVQGPMYQLWSWEDDDGGDIEKPSIEDIKSEANSTNVSEFLLSDDWFGTVVDNLDLDGDSVRAYLDDSEYDSATETTLESIAASLNESAEYVLEDAYYRFNTADVTGAEMMNYLYHGDWSDLPPPAVEMKAVEEWETAYGARPIFISETNVIFHVATPPSSIEEARTLAELHVNYSPSTFVYGEINFEKYAESLMTAEYWDFNWD